MGLRRLWNAVVGGTGFQLTTQASNPSDANTLWKRTSDGAVLIGSDQLTQISNQVLNVKNYGATGDNSTDDTAAITAAITAANLLSIAGCLIGLYFPSGIYMTTSTVSMRSNVALLGTGFLKRKDSDAPLSTAMWTLLSGSGLSNFLIDGLGFINVGPDTKIAYSMIDTSEALGAMDGAIDLDNCSKFVIRFTNCRRGMEGISVSNSDHFSFHHNDVNSLSSKTLSSLDDGSYIPYVFATGSRGTGIALRGNRNGVIQQPCQYFSLSDNEVECVGLDTGIDVGSQGYYQWKGKCQNNKVRGFNGSGIAVYTGSIADVGAGDTTDRGVLVSGNQVLWCYDQGIYIRAVAGVLVTGNYITRCGLTGIASSGGTASGGIVNRIPTNQSYTLSSIYWDHGNQIHDNYVIDCGNPLTGTCESAIRCDTWHTSVRGNYILRSKERFGANINASPSAGVRMLAVGADSYPTNNAIAGNHIRGFEYGVTIGYATTRVNRTTISLIVEHNPISLCTFGVNVESYCTGVDVRDNDISETTTTAIRVRNSPGTRVRRNMIDSGATGIDIRSGNLQSDLDGTANRGGATLVITENRINGCTTAIGNNEVSGTDGTRLNRCIELWGNVVNGNPGDTTANAHFTAAPTSASNMRTWQLGERAPNQIPAAAAVPGWRCTTAGTFGTLAGVTASSTSGTPVIVVNTTAGLWTGAYISVVGVSGTKRIVSIAGTSVTLDSNSSATVAGAAAAYVAPVFKGEAALSA